MVWKKKKKKQQNKKDQKNPFLFHHFCSDISFPSSRVFWGLVCWSHLNWVWNPLVLSASQPPVAAAASLQPSSCIPRWEMSLSSFCGGDPIFVCSLTAELIRVFLCFQMFDFFLSPQYFFFFFNFWISNSMPLWSENKVWMISALWNVEASPVDISIPHVCGKEVLLVAGCMAVLHALRQSWGPCSPTPSMWLGALGRGRETPAPGHILATSLASCVFFCILEAGLGTSGFSTVTFLGNWTFILLWLLLSLRRIFA